MVGRGVEYERVELPLIRQLVGLAWEHVEGSTQDPALTGRESFREVILAGRLRDGLRRINRGPDGNPWLDDSRLSQAASVLLRPRATRLIEVNQELTEALLIGTTVPGLPGWDGSRDQAVRFIDWEHPERNDFCVVNQFRVDRPSAQGRKRITPDLVLFVNGIPLVIIEAKSPETVEPIAKAIDQLRRYANRRDPALAEGSEKLFGTNQFVVATCYERALAGTFTAEPEHFAEWKTTEPTPESEVAEALGVARLSSQERLVAGMLAPERLLDLVRHYTLFMPAGPSTVKVVARYQQYRACRQALHRLRTGATRVRDGESDRRGGIIWHTQGSGKSLTMVFLVRAMRSDPDLIRFKIIVVTDRHQLQEQLSATATLTGETVQVAAKVAELRTLLATPGKSLLFAMIQKYQDPNARRADDAALKSLGVQDTSDQVLVLVDEAHRSHASQLHAHLLEALPNAARIGFTGTPIIMGKHTHTHRIFGEYIDRYTIAQSEADGATVPILYEGRTTRSAVTDGHDLDEVFEDMFAERTPEELEQIKRRWVTTGEVLEAPRMIAAKARSMLRHYVDTVLPEGFKAQVVATSRLAAVRYREAFLAARDELLSELNTLDPALRTAAAADHASDVSCSLPARTARLVRAWPHRDLIAALDFVPVISERHNDPEDWRTWTDKSRQDAATAEFVKPLPAGDDSSNEAETGRTSPVAFLIVKSMLLTGFDAPVEQVLYLDRRIREAELLQAVARVNRTARGKRVGYVVDYFGVAEHLTAALAAYSADDVEGALASIADELPRLAQAHQRVRNLFASRGAHGFDTEADQSACVDLLAEEPLRAAFEAALRQFLVSLETVLPRPEALPHVADAKAFGVIAHRARRRYREDGGFDPSVYGQKVRRLIDDHVVALEIDQKIPPISLTAPDFAEKVAGLRTPRAKASEMEHAIRYHIRGHFDEDPEHYRRLSERLEQILSELDQQWDQLALALADFLPEVGSGRRDDGSGLDPATESPFYHLLRGEVTRAAGEPPVAVDAILRQVTVDIVRRVRLDIALIDFWQNPHAQDMLRRRIILDLDAQRVDGEDLFDYERLEPLADRIVELASANHARLVVT